jgi:hypothetical protein
LREPGVRKKGARALAAGAVMMAVAAKNAGTNEMSEYATRKARELAADARAARAKVKDERIDARFKSRNIEVNEKQVSDMENELVANGL